jgi:hypothetical protein
LILVFAEERREREEKRGERGGERRRRKEERLSLIFWENFLVVAGPSPKKLLELVDRKPLPHWSLFSQKIQ